VPSDNDDRTDYRRLVTRGHRFEIDDPDRAEQIAESDTTYTVKRLPAWARQAIHDKIRYALTYGELSVRYRRSPTQVAKYCNCALGRSFSEELCEIISSELKDSIVALQSAAVDVLRDVLAPDSTYRKSERVKVALKLLEHGILPPLQSEVTNNAAIVVQVNPDLIAPPMRDANASDESSTEAD
jgi:hypothetical protein